MFSFPQINAKQGTTTNPLAGAERTKMKSAAVHETMTDSSNNDGAINQNESTLLLQQSSLAAYSARNSWKRTRVLYDVNPQAAFVPTVDATIYAQSLARRKRRVRRQVPQQHQSNKNAGNNSLALITQGNDASKNALTSKQGNSNIESISTALVPALDGSNPSEPKQTGILVVSSLDKTSSNVFPILF